MTRKLKIIRHSALIDEYDFVLSYNDNSDHLRYLTYYQSIGLRRLTRPIIGKRALITTVGVKEFLIGMLLILLGNKVTHIIHDLAPHPGKKRGLTLVYNFFATRFFRVAFHSFNQAFLFSGECAIFHLPIVTSRTPEDDARPTREDGKYSVLAFGRYESYKNFQFINILAGLDNSNIHLVVAGNGVSQVISEENVEVHDAYIPEEELDQLISDSDMVILPYTSGTQSGVIVKAFERLRPCAVSHESSLEEYIVDNALGFEFSLSDGPLAIAGSIEEFMASWSVNKMYKQLTELEELWIERGTQKIRTQGIDVHVSTV